MQEPTTEPIELEGAPALSRAGNLFILLAFVWAIAGQLVIVATLRSLGIPGEDASPLLLVAVFAVYLAVSFGPLLMAYVSRRAAHRLPFRWLLASPQPGARLNSGGIELCTPQDGCSRFNWNEIASLEPTHAWLEAKVVEVSPTLDLLSVDGRVLMRVPPSVYEELHPVGGRWHSGPRTLAERVVAMRPDRFAVAGTKQDPPHYWFKLVDDTWVQPRNS